MELCAFIHELHSTSTFEQAAERLLDRALGCIGPELADTVTVLRGMVHLRPDDSYRGVVLRQVVEVETAGVQFMPSTTAWRWVVRAQGPVLLDVQRAQVTFFGNPSRPSEATQRPDFRSRDAVLTRHATHILACPLRRAGQRLDGYLSLEVAVQGEPAEWSEFVRQLQCLVDIAAPFVGELPRELIAGTGGEPGLPVIGAKMREKIDDLRLFAATDCTILLSGETGVGKFYLARWCWQQSARKDRPFERVDLAERPENLREGELFGWRKGSFSGAIDNRIGLVERVTGGTLFIDEIDKLPLAGQAMLLSLLDDGQYRVIGDSEQRYADVRFIVGTNVDLAAAMERGAFLPDLYYRIQELPFHLPPLRQRRDEIVRWARYQLNELQKKAQRRGEIRLAAAADALLERQEWPGNVRQLGSVMMRAYQFAARDAGEGELHVGARHVERALTNDTPPDRDALWRNLERAAKEFVTQAQALREESPERVLTLEHADAFKGFVLRDAVARVGEREAFQLLGEEKRLDSSNHRRVLRREEQRVMALARALGRALEPD